jgi:glycosyltransferase involved in cell wall biosynthesis
MNPDPPHDPPDASSSYSEKLSEYINEAPLERQPIIEFVAAAAASLPEGSRIADVGAGSAPFRELFSHVDYMTVDRAQSLHGDSSDYDVVAPAEAIPLKDASLDAILCTQVLEHVPEPAEALAEFFRLLKPEGKLFLTAPLVWEEHEMPDDYFRYTRSGLDYLLSKAGFERIEIIGRTDCFSTLAQLLRNARWSLGEAEDDSKVARQTAFLRLEEMAEELLQLTPLDARQAFPLGYQVVATRPKQRATSQVSKDGYSHSRINLAEDQRIPILYLAPWVDLGGSDKGTIDWFKHIDRSRWAPSIITTQPSANRWLPELEPYADEVWSLPDLMRGSEFPPFILGFIESRHVEVVHIMNSRLGFDLMPDMRCLPNPPVVVVQHHAEEHDRSGYVRYVAARYGNLVDAFSVTSQQLANAMMDYDVPRSRMHVIPTGVDGLEEFNPDRVAPFDLATTPGSRILWPGRLVTQKDPMLTLKVVKLLAEREVSFSLHVVGDGEMKDDVVNYARELCIDHLIHWHPPSYEMPRWYRSSDLLLMTSMFEGVPYVIYEALAMGVPVVAPALPGNVELMGTSGGVLIEPREDAAAYADAIQLLLNDDPRRQEIATAARKKMLENFSLRDMGRRHDALYEHLLTHRPTSSRHGAEAAATPDAEVTSNLPLVSFPRNPPPERSVAVIVPCFQHGRFLPEAIQSLREQTLAPQRVIVVDDASADPETTEVLDNLEQDPFVTVIRLAENSGPSIARNRALSEITESYVLPLDADDMLLATTLEEMVDQLERAPESVGFIYPNVQHFGNRNDFYQPPAYNLNMLLNNNYCAATSLFDRRVFTAGIRYAEDIVFGHEDWDLVLQMAERGIEGEAAERAIFMYRKRGFSRVNAVEYGPKSFHERISRRHPLLYGRRRDQIKAEWAPSMSLVLVDGCDGLTMPWRDDLGECLRAQSCSDFETICTDFVLNSPSELQAWEMTDGVQTAVEAARGRFVLLAGVGVADALGGCAFVEQVIRLFWGHADLSRLVLASAPDQRGPRLRLLSACDVVDAIPHAVAWRRGESESYKVDIGVTGTPIEDIIMRWQADSAIEWRAL